MNNWNTDSLNEYLVTVYDKGYNRLGAYTLYGESNEEVYGKWLDRRNDNEYYAEVVFCSGYSVFSRV